MGKSHLFSAHPIDLKTYAANPHCVLSDRKYRNTDSRDALCAPKAFVGSTLEKFWDAKSPEISKNIYLRAN